MKEFDRLVEIMEKVQQVCPWDKEQTHHSLKQYIIEETYEVIDAIESENDVSLKEELGDVLIQIIFHSILAEERQKFSLKEVLTEVSDKLVRRHPHVFKDVKVIDAKDVLKKWENIKMGEGGKSSILDGVPHHLPALLKAYRVQSKASRVGFDWSKSDDVISKVQEELYEFINAVKENKKEQCENEMGDLLFSLVNLSRFIDVNPEDALRKTITKFTKRFHYIEEKLKSKNTSIESSTLEEMDILWEEAKRII